MTRRNPDIYGAVIDAQAALESAVLTAIQCRDYGTASDPNYAASLDHAEEMAALAARDLTAAIAALPATDRPIGWDEHSFGPFSTEPETAKP